MVMLRKRAWVEWSKFNNCGPNCGSRYTTTPTLTGDKNPVEDPGVATGDYSCGTTTNPILNGIRFIPDTVCQNKNYHYALDKT